MHASDAVRLGNRLEGDKAKVVAFNAGRWTPALLRRLDLANEGVNVLALLVDLVAEELDLLCQVIDGIVLLPSHAHEASNAHHWPLAGHFAALEVLAKDLFKVLDSFVVFGDQVRKVSQSTAD